MATRKRATSLRKTDKVEEQPVWDQPEKTDKVISSPNKKRKTWPFVLLIVLLLVLLGLGYFLRGQYLVAIVDGRPIFRFQLNQKMLSSYGKATLEEMIMEDLIREEAAKKKIDVTSQEVDQEVAKFEKSLGAGTKLDDFLKYQGMSLADFREQLKLKLQVDKILDKDITVTEDEISSYIKANEKNMVATGEAERKAEATEQIKSQKINQKIQSWLSDLMAKAKITRFLK